jgi:hypothetical protein
VKVNFTEDFVGIKALNKVPPIGKYEAVRLEFIKTRSSKWDIKSDKTDGFRMKPFVKDNSPSPVTYKVHESFQKT